MGQIISYLNKLTSTEDHQHKLPPIEYINRIKNYPAPKDWAELILCDHHYTFAIKSETGAQAHYRIVTSFSEPHKKNFYAWLQQGHDFHYSANVLFETDQATDKIEGFVSIQTIMKKFNLTCPADVTEASDFWIQDIVLRNRTRDDKYGIPGTVAWFRVPDAEAKPRPSDALPEWLKPKPSSPRP